MSLPLLFSLPRTVFPGMNLAAPSLNHQIRISLAILLLVTVSGCTGSSPIEENKPTGTSSQDTEKTSTAAKEPTVEKNVADKKTYKKRLGGTIPSIKTRFCKLCIF